MAYRALANTQAMKQKYSCCAHEYVLANKQLTRSTIRADPRPLTLLAMQAVYTFLSFHFYKTRQEGLQLLRNLTVDTVFRISCDS